MTWWKPIPASIDSNLLNSQLIETETAKPLSSGKGVLLYWGAAAVLNSDSHHAAIAPVITKLVSKNHDTDQYFVTEVLLKNRDDKTIKAKSNRLTGEQP
jgi:hypothetical protein